MNRNQSLTAGAIVAASLLLRPALNTPAPAPGETAHHTPAAGKSSTAPEEGPWLASCKYWEPYRGFPSDAEKKKASVSISIKTPDALVDSISQTTSGEAERCPVPSAQKPASSTPGDRWGIPSGPSGQKPEIHAIVATVHDPVHSHQALNFDRDIDALVQAAGENDYLPSYFWLPWKTHSGALHAEESLGAEESADDLARQRQPGLIVFKQVPLRDPTSGEFPKIMPRYPEVVYLFLAAETPTLGVDGAQIGNAFRYETELKGIQTANVTFSMKSDPSENGPAIIGPSNSGSAASLRAAIESARHAKDSAGKDSIFKSSIFEVAGTTQTDLASKILYEPLSTSSQAEPADVNPHYVSFGDNWAFEYQQFLSNIDCSGYRFDRVAVLSEDSTVFGDQGVRSGKTLCKTRNGLPVNAGLAPLYIRFPREISLLRNAHTEGGEHSGGEQKSAPTPFLHLQLKDPGNNDSVPQFSPEQTPLSQEAQLMSISRLLERRRVQFICINASNVLDGLFLARFLHRAIPEARLFFIAGDLLFERETENDPYVGTVTLSAYSLLNPTPSQLGSRVPVRAFTDSVTEAYFNAASYTFWNGQKTDDLHLANYRSLFQDDSSLHTPQWATVVGTDGYYPLGLVAECASNEAHILPWIGHSATPPASKTACTETEKNYDQTPPKPAGSSICHFLSDFDFNAVRYSLLPYRYPSLSWEMICVAIALLCLAHAGAVSFPRYWSPYTRDLVIPQGDKRHRRAMYIFIGTAMLSCMAFVTAYPVFPSFRVVHPNWQTAAYAIGAVLAAAIALVATLRKTWRYLGASKLTERSQIESKGLDKLYYRLVKNATLLFNLVAAVALFLIPWSWASTCNTVAVSGVNSYAGPFFSYRCLYPGSGVCPLVPTLLILFSWYIWAVSQTLRLRFSKMNRPILPGRVGGKFAWQLYVTDEDITEDGLETSSYLVSNLSCLLITRDVVQRYFPERKWRPTLCLLAVYFVLFLCLVSRLEPASVDRFLWNTGERPTAYEFLLATLAFPLLMIGLSGWLRMMLIWGSLKRGVLETLEQLPLRYAFNRLKGVSWVNMMRQGGLVEQWRDMARSTESLRQMANDPDLAEAMIPKHWESYEALRYAHIRVDRNIARLYRIIQGGDASAQPSKATPPPHSPAIYMSGVAPKPVAETPARKKPDPKAGLHSMNQIEKNYASACEALLQGLLLPYWEQTRVGLVEGEELTELPIKASTLPREDAESSAKARNRTPLQLHTSTVAEEPNHIRVAEEFLAIRYVSLIRAVLVNMRRILVFILAVFVLTIIAWNSYPFQPRQWIDEAFTALFILLGVGLIWVFAQMHRDPILSRITDTNANELGIDFYLRIGTFGAVPLLTWLAYQFPEVGGSLFRAIQPSLDVFK